MKLHLSKCKLTTTVATNTSRNLCYVQHEFKYKDEDIDLKNYNIHENYHVDKGQLTWNFRSNFSWCQISPKLNDILGRIFALASERGSTKKNKCTLLYKEYVLCHDVLVNNGQHRSILIRGI